LPLAGIAVALIDLVISSAIFFLMLLFYNVALPSTMIWFFPLLVLLLLFTCSMSLVLSALNVYYRDVKLAISFLIQLWFFATPVFYSVDKVDPKFKFILFLNPLTFIIENMRRCLIENRGVPAGQFLVMLAINTVIFIWSFYFFRLTEKRFADVI
jgi:ABC-type polysaccharide/polyol phosphate export permease